MTSTSRTARCEIRTPGGVAGVAGGNPGAPMPIRVARFPGPRRVRQAAAVFDFDWGAGFAILPERRQRVQTFTLR